MLHLVFMDGFFTQIILKIILTTTLQDRLVLPMAITQQKLTILEDTGNNNNNKIV